MHLPPRTFSCILKLLLRDVVYRKRIYWIQVIDIQLLPYVFTEHERQISCEIKMKSLLWSLCVTLSQEELAMARYSSSQWCISYEWKQQCMHLVGISRHIPVVCLFFHTVIISHKQDQFSLYLHPTFLFYGNNNVLLSCLERNNLLR